MKGIRPMTTEERQARHREREHLKGAVRLSVTLSREAVNALEVIQQDLNTQGLTHSKKAAIEAALCDRAYGWSTD